MLFAEELKVSNEGKHKNDRRRANDALQAMNMEDPYDDEVYKYALKKFEAMVTSSQ